MLKGRFDNIFKGERVSIVDSYSLSIFSANSIIVCLFCLSHVNVFVYSSLTDQLPNRELKQSKMTLACRCCADVAVYQRCRLDFTLWNWKPHLAQMSRLLCPEVSTGNSRDICYLLAPVVSVCFTFSSSNCI